MIRNRSRMSIVIWNHYTISGNLLTRLSFPCNSEGMHVMRFEGPPGSGRTSSAIRFFRDQRLRVPDGEDDDSDVALMTMQDVLHGVALPGRRFQTSVAERRIEHVVFELAEKRCRALLVESAHDIFRVAGDQAPAVMSYMRDACAGAGLEYFVCEDMQPALHFAPPEWLAMWESPAMGWLREPASISYARPADKALMATAMQSMVWDSVSRSVLLPFSAVIQLVQFGNYRGRLVSVLAEKAARICLDRVKRDEDADATVSDDDVVAALVYELARSHHDHAALLRGPISRLPACLPLCEAAALSAQFGGVAPVGSLVCAHVERTVKAPVSKGSINHAARGLVTAGVLWAGADGRVVLADPLLASRLAFPDCHEMASRLAETTKPNDRLAAIASSLKVGWPRNPNAEKPATAAG